MKEVKDPEIKLFGKKICLPENDDIIQAGEESTGDSGVGNSPGFDSDCKKVIGVEESETEIEDEKIDVVAENFETLLEEKEIQNVEVVSICEDSRDSTYMDEDCTEKQCSDTENDQGDTNNSQQKTLKKPDKILPCPRCSSMDTKFCYYNNYNVNQPRHFCKSCQRYWTAGGTMRNVPVGAGRRKNKIFASHCHPINVTETIKAAQMDAPNGFCHPNIKPNGSILSFGPELPLSDSMALVLNLTDKNVANCGSNGFYKLDPIPSVCEKAAGNATNCSSCSSIVAHEPVLQHMNGFPFPVPYFPGVPWPFPLNPAVPISAFCPPGYPMPIYPAHLWNCSMTGGWTFPWLPPSTSPASQNSSVSSPNSSTLGKHSRDGEAIKPKDSESKEWQEPKSSEGSVLVPKTLRIDDPEEAAKSSIWTTLGIKYDSKRRGGLFKAFEQKTNEKKHFPSSTSSSALWLNPAAFSRSLTFQETA